MPGSDATQPIEFDGIALTLVADLKAMEGRASDAYYTEVVKPDEERFLDKDAPGAGIVAIFVGENVPIMEDGKVIAGRR
jgi:hypothetical protein